MRKCAQNRLGEKGDIMGILYQAIDPISWVWWLFVLFVLFVLFALMAFNKLGRTSK